MQDNYLSSTYRFNLRIVETDFFFYKMSAPTVQEKGVGGHNNFFSIYNILSYNTYMSVVCNFVRNFICLPWFVIFALIDNVNATIHVHQFNRLS